MGAGTFPTTSSAAETLTFGSQADARVEEASPSTNYGTQTSLHVDGSPNTRSYVRFSVSGVSGGVTSAKLRVYAHNGSADGPAVYATSNTWSEATISWSNRPALTGNPSDDKGSVPTGWAEYNVTPLVTGDGTYSFVFEPTSGDSVDMYSREAAGYQPQLVLTTGGSSTSPTPTPSPTSTPPTSGSDPVLVGAGDIGNCTTADDEATAKLLDAIGGTVFTVGDNAYPDGTASDFANCYDPTWGRHKARTKPAPGNHEYHTTGATPYFDYFGAAAGERGKGWYSYNLGQWHVIVLNTNYYCQAPSCSVGSEQEKWLRADLAAHPNTCTLAYFHEPRFSSGSHGSSTAVQPFWQALYDHGADVVLSGHDHNYERFAPQNPTGSRDDTKGIRQFVTGMGGTSLRSFSTIRPNSEARNSDTHGVLKLTLHSTAYSWQFVPEAGKSYSDSGSTACN